MLKFHIFKIWIKRHCCPRKSLGNRCRCDSILMIFKTNFHFSFLFFLPYRSVDFSPGLFLSCTWCWNSLSREWKYFFSEKEFSNYLKKPQIQTLNSLFSCISNPNLCGFFPACHVEVSNCIWKAALEICGDLRLIPEEGKWCWMLRVPLH